MTLPEALQWTGPLLDKLAATHLAGLQVTFVLPPKAWGYRLRSPPPWADRTSPTSQKWLAPPAAHRAPSRRLPGKGNPALTQAPTLGRQAALALTQGPWQGHQTSPSQEVRGQAPHRATSRGGWMAPDSPPVGESPSIWVNRPGSRFTALA